LSEKNFGDAFHDRNIVRNIVLMRHGRTDWNDAHRFQGRTDIPLNDKGLAQAEKTADRLAKWPVDAVYTSPMIRACQTAQPIANRHGRKPIVLNDLVEVDFGPWENQSFENIRCQYPDLMRKWMKDPFFRAPEGAETWESIRIRAERAIEVVLREEGKRVVVVSHGGIMRALFSVLLGLDPHVVWNIKASNCALNGIEVRKDQTLLAFSNDELHLKEELTDITLPVW
jgi:broad specificity phosphatase PhoE